MEESRTNSFLPLLGVVSVWVPAMIASSYSWRYGEYYDYGWFVPPLAVFLMIRRWLAEGGGVALPSRRAVVVVSLAVVPWILALRILGNTDPAWRMPIGLLGITAAALSHWLIAVARGWRVSAGYIWITLFWLSAVPWPTFLENGIVRELTDLVIRFVAESFHFLGKPVEIVGDRLRLHEMTVEVTDGCSGIRSFQGFVMATWFFSEIQRLRIFQSMVLMILACLIAFSVNAARTYGLASIRFESGQEAFDSAHDLAGLIAFLVSGVLFYVISGYLSTEGRKKVVRTVQRT